MLIGPPAAQRIVDEAADVAQRSRRRRERSDVALSIGGAIGEAVDRGGHRHDRGVVIADEFCGGEIVRAFECGRRICAEDLEPELPAQVVPQRLDGDGAGEVVLAPQERDHLPEDADVLPGVGDSAMIESTVVRRCSMSSVRPRRNVSSIVAASNER